MDCRKYIRDIGNNDISEDRGNVLLREAELLPFWGTMDEAQRFRLCRHLQLKDYAEAIELEIGSVVSKESIWMITRGKVDVIVRSMEGRQRRLMRLLSGDGGFSCTMLNSNSYSVEANISENTRIISVDDTYSRTLIATNEQAGKYCAEANGYLMRRLLELLGEASFEPLKERLLRSLRESCTEQDSREIAVTHDELANSIGTSREVVSRLLKELERCGAVKLMRGKIRILASEEGNKSGEI